MRTRRVLAVQERCSCQLEGRSQNVIRALVEGGILAVGSRESFDCDGMTHSGFTIQKAATMPAMEPLAPIELVMRMFRKTRDDMLASVPHTPPAT